MVDSRQGECGGIASCFAPLVSSAVYDANNKVSAVGSQQRLRVTKTEGAPPRWRRLASTNSVPFFEWRPPASFDRSVFQRPDIFFESNRKRNRKHHVNDE